MHGAATEAQHRMVRTQAINLHPRAAVVPWLSRLDRESGLGGGSEDAPGVVELDLK